MARRFTCGFEENNFTETIWSVVLGTTPTIVTTSPHSGTYRMDTANVVGASGLRYTFQTTKTSGTLTSRTLWRTSLATPNVDTILYRTLSNASALAVTLSLRTTGVLRLTNNVTPTNVDTTTVVSINTWYRIEVRHLLHDTNGEMEVRLYSGSTLLETIQLPGLEDTLPVDIARIEWGKFTTTVATHPIFSYDDIAVNDESGSFQNSWPGPGKIFLLVPNSDVSITWEDQAAGTATFAHIDDLPGAPDDATTYNTEVVNLNSVDRFGLTDLGAEVPSNAVITLADVFARVGSNAALAANMQLKIWDEASSLTNGPAVVTGLNGWKRLNENEHLVYNATGKTKANFDSFNAGYENITHDATRERRITALWVNVEWTEGPSGTTITGLGQKHQGFIYARPYL